MLGTFQNILLKLHQKAMQSEITNKLRLTRRYFNKKISRIKVLPHITPIKMYPELRYYYMVLYYIVLNTSFIWKVMLEDLGLHFV